MQFSTLALSALLSTASAVSVTVVKVANVNNALIYSPDSITAKAGDMVQFQFEAGNHTVTQSTFDQPCQPISDFTKTVGFHSGFIPVTAASGVIPTYTITINDTKPIWVYCAQGKHCEAGMVMVINQNTTANATRSLEGYKALAAKASTIVPGSASSGTKGTTTNSTSSSTSSSSSTGSSSSSSSSVVTTSGGSVLSVPSIVTGMVAVASYFLL
ncbi:hypothetical protein CMQ_6683 [Grosmannia clavigera kw1407]|uniref:Extracellular serine-rich protein n=1 Tax=Grosmannia clavigera (strain kw1407 / UAMH 11150) TaxID=655863 RepID=F0X723_GROCL|nr:uncharacterized protein CMQ_6683 [Grosmannia clavigera kw1407]EFX06362.1 hypothetical protein CMQ_6683 [Grosmannia clavigera kw1407]